MIANPIPWPDGARCAVAMTWDMDADSAFNWYNKETADNLVAAQSWTRYDPLIAIPRLVEQFARLGLHLTFFVPGWVIEKYPAQIDLLLKNGHEIALHGYLHERSNEIANDEEHYWLGRGLDAYRKHLGAGPRGWRAPSFAFSKHSLRYLLEAGLEYDSSLMGDDIPYALRPTPRQRLAARISRRLDTRRLPALRPQPRSRLPDADLLAATRDGGLPQRVRRGLGVRRVVDIGLASGIVGPPSPVQGGDRPPRLYARQRRRLVRAARPGVRPCAEADGGGALDTALRELPNLPKPAPRILQRTVSSGTERSHALALLPMLDLSARSFSVSSRCRLGAAGR